MRHLSFDICVVGGGPAGVATAIRLVQLGHTVTLVEKCRFPRRHMGQTLAPSVLPLLEILGVRDQVEAAGFLRSSGTWLRWASDEPEYRAISGPRGFHVERDRFDSLLLRSAQAAGVRVVHPARVVELQRIAEHNWKAEIAGEVGTAEIRTRALVYASGRSNFAGLGRKPTAPGLLALTGNWFGTRPCGDETRIEAGANEWFWGSPLASRVFNAAVFLEPARLRPEIATAGSLQQVYCRLLERSCLLKSCLAGQLMGSARAYDATCYAHQKLATADSIKTGEAAFTIDPLSSQGVVAAIGSGLHAATVLHTILCRPSATEIAIEFYQNRIQRSVESNRRSAYQFYSEAARMRPSAFWQARISSGGTIDEFREAISVREDGLICLSSDVRIGRVPVVRGDFVDSAVGIFAPSLSGPVAFLDSVELAPLLSVLNGRERRDKLMEIWQRDIPRERASAVFRWMLEKKILVHAHVP
jgi:flavin-dependent dehydrogenase